MDQPFFPSRHDLMPTTTRDDHDARRPQRRTSCAELVKSIFETITDDEVRLFVCPAFSSSNQPAHSVGPRLVFPPSSVAQPCANAVFSIYSHFPTGACHTLQGKFVNASTFASDVR
ncbi:hypothetical protein BDZ89DRAFT_736024 [Hymenopellis radicata]|nr:hypothetical protein BDZ89DRAFT_736024 [Hymenopellis radicata]